MLLFIGPWCNFENEGNFRWKNIVEFFTILPANARYGNFPHSNPSSHSAPQAQKISGQLVELVMRYPFSKAKSTVFREMGFKVLET